MIINNHLVSESISQKIADLSTVGQNLVRDRPVAVALAVGITKAVTGNAAQARRKIHMASSARDMTVKITKVMKTLLKSMAALLKMEWMLWTKV